jgi:hypothetical protein
MNPLLELQLGGTGWMGIKDFLGYPEIRIAGFKIPLVVLLDGQYRTSFQLK